MFDYWQVSGRHKGAQQFAIPAAIAMLAHLPGVEKRQQKMALLVKCRDLVGDFRDATSRPRQGVVKLVGGAPHRALPVSCAPKPSVADESHTIGYAAEPL